MESQQQYILNRDGDIEAKAMNCSQNQYKP